MNPTCSNRSGGAIASLVAAALVALAAGMGGCQARSAIRDYPGATPEQVWKAALAAAEDPIPGPWHVIENGVWSDEAERRIELHRVLKRDVFEPGASSTYREERDWAVSIRLLAPELDERRYAVAVEIADRTLAFPRKFHSFTDMYFDDIERRLKHTPKVPAAPHVGNGLMSPDATYAPQVPKMAPDAPAATVAPAAPTAPAAPSTDPAPEPVPEPEPDPIPPTN